MSQHAVVGTSMVAMIFPSAVSLYTHHRLGNVRWPVGRMLLGGSALGACLGVQVALAPAADKEVAADKDAGARGG